MENFHRVGGSPIPPPPHKEALWLWCCPSACPPPRRPLALAIFQGLLETEENCLSLPLSAADREALLAALSVRGGNDGAARRMALAYPPGALDRRLDDLADRVFAPGRRTQNVLSSQQVDGCARCGGDRTDGNCSPLYEHLCADCAEVEVWQTVVGPR